MILSTLAAHKGQLDNLQASVNELSAKVDALSKANGVKLAAKTDWAGDQTFTASSWGTRSVPVSTGSWTSSGYMMSTMSSGSCANGQCGVMRGGLFGRRR
jgi:hypothetical protein